MVILLLSARIRRLRTGWSSACKWQERTPNFAGQTDLPAVGKSNPGIELRQISTTGKSLLIFRNRVKPRNQKYFPSPPTQIRCISKPSRPDRGALRTSRNAGRDAVDAAASGEQQRAGRMMPKRTAKSCGSDAPMPASSLREDAQATVSNKHGHRGEREVSRKTIAQGMPGRSGVTVVTTLGCLFPFGPEAAGASGARHSLRPLMSEGQTFAKPRAHPAARMRTHTLSLFEK